MTTHLEEIDRLKGELARPVADPAAARQAVWDIVKEYGPAVTDCWSNRDYAKGEALLADWERLLDEQEHYLTDNGRRVARGRLNHSAGEFWLSRATFDYYLNSDFIYPWQKFERAEGCFERALAQFRAIEIGAGEDGFRQLREQFVADLQARLSDAGGMKLFTQGQFEREAGDLPRAEKLLGDAAAIMRGAANQPGAAQSAEGDLPLSLLFVDYAEAALQQSLSDKALLFGKLAAAAQAETARADALDRCQAKYARLNPAMIEANAHWVNQLDRDAYIARQRHERLDAAAARQPRHASLRFLLFIVILLVLVAAVWGVSSWAGAHTFDNSFAVIALFVFAFLSAGVGAGLTSFREAEERGTRLVALAAFPRDKTAPAS